MRRTLSLSRALAPAVLVLALAGLTGCTEAPEPEATSAAPVASSPSPTDSADGTDETAETDAADSDGDSSSESASDESSDSGNQSSGQTSPNQPSAAPSTAAAPPPPAAPTVTVLSQQCVSGKLRVIVQASYDGSYRKGINAVTYERQNEYNAWLDADATWSGPETGAGDQWTGNPPGHKNQRFKDQLRITVTASGGAQTVVTVQITANC